MEMVYLDQLTHSVYTLGPGRRIGIWVQGCSLKCFGCMSEDLFYRREKSCLSVEDIFDHIFSLAPGHSGLTVSGGEPFDQAEALLPLLIKVKRSTTLDTMVYSGYTKEEILNGSKAMVDLFTQIDILIDGRFEAALPTRKPWCGSDNQTIHLLTKHAQQYNNLIKEGQCMPTSLQVEVTNGNAVRIIGIPRRGELEQLREQLLQRGIMLKQ